MLIEDASIGDDVSCRAGYAIHKIGALIAEEKLDFIDRRRNDLVQNNCGKKYSRCQRQDC
jgi:hypothetical protein